MWSSRWDASSLDQLKTSRQVPVNLVFETAANALFDNCLPTQLIPFKRSIVIVAPERIVKVTAPDEERHRMWLTALRYIAESTVKLDEDRWAAELRARFEVLSATDLSFPSEYEARAAGGLLPPPTNLTTARAVSPNLFEEKPLPPSPPRSTISRSTHAITPPAVPRWLRSRKGKQRADPSTSGGDTSSDFHLPSRGSGDEPVPALELPRIEAGDNDLDADGRLGRHQVKTPDSEAERAEAEKQQLLQRGQDDEHEHEHTQPLESTKRGTSMEDDPEATEAEQRRRSRRLSSEEFAVDQIEMLVDRLGAI
jgi:hypothetical protein